MTSEDLMARGGPDSLKRASGRSSQCPTLQTHLHAHETFAYHHLHLPFTIRQAFSPLQGMKSSICPSSNSPPTSSNTQWDLLSVNVWSGLICLIRSPPATVAVPCMKDDSPWNSDSHLRNTNVFRKCQIEVVSQPEAGKK